MVTRRAIKFRAIKFRVIAVCLGLIPVVVIEIAARACLVREASESLGRFERIDPLFTREEDQDRYAVAADRLGYFRPESFPAIKPVGHKRVFCLGGSTVQGRPYATETAWPSWLEIRLNAAADPGNEAVAREDSTADSPWDCINCGGVSYASYRLTPIVREILRYEPDVVILMTGHNEFLEDRELATAPEDRPTLRSVELARRWFRGAGQPREPRPLLPAEVDALLDYEGGLEEYTLDLTWRAQVADQFEANLREIVRLCEEASVPLLLVNPVSNLRDTPPFKVEHGPDFSAESEQVWNATVEGFANHQTPTDKATMYALLRNIDPWHAGAWYNQAKYQDADREFELARESYEAARDTDACPLRMTSDLIGRWRNVAVTTGTAHIDMQQLFAMQSQHGIVDSEWTLDHVHPTIAGHQLIAERISQWFVESGLATSSRGWNRRYQTQATAHREQLPNSYFTEGARRLERLTNWARGRGEKIRK